MKNDRAVRSSVISDREEILCAVEAKPCPWCGTQPTIQPWHGGRPTKRLIGCGNDDCAAAPSVTGQTRREALDAWNTRVDVKERS